MSLSSSILNKIVHALHIAYFEIGLTVLRDYGKLTRIENNLGSPVVALLIAILKCTESCYCIKQIDSILRCVCSVIDHRRRQNVVRTSVTHSPSGLWATFLFFPYFDVICDL